MDNQNNKDNLEEIVDRQYKRVQELDKATMFIKSMSLCYHLFYIIQF